MRVIFMGSPAWAVPSLERIAASGHEILAVVSQPDRRSRRRGTPEPPPVARRAREMGLALRQPLTVKTAEFLDWFGGLAPDAGVIVAYGEILPKRLLAVAPHGFVNLHFSLLPKYRGAAPVQWAIASGETTTGVTTMAVVPKLDAGDIFLQREAAIGPAETAPELGERLAALGAPLLVETLDGIARGDLARRPQRHDEASYAPRLSREDGRIDWRLRSDEIARRARGFVPWPGSFTRVRGRDVRLVSVEPQGDRIAAPPEELVPGTVLGLDVGALRVLCGEGTVLRVTRLVFEGGRPVDASDAVNGRLLAAGDTLGEASGSSGD